MDTANGTCCAWDWCPSASQHRTLDVDCRGPSAARLEPRSRKYQAVFHRWRNCEFLISSPKWDLHNFFLFLYDVNLDFHFFTYGIPLIDGGSQFLGICRINHSKWSNMGQKMTSDHRSLYLCYLWGFHCVLLVLCGQMYARRVFSFGKKHVPRFCEHVLDALMIGSIFMEFGVPGGLLHRFLNLYCLL